MSGPRASQRHPRACSDTQKYKHSECILNSRAGPKGLIGLPTPPVYFKKAELLYKEKLAFLQLHYMISSLILPCNSVYTTSMFEYGNVHVYQ